MTNSTAYNVAKTGGTVSTNGKPTQEKQNIDTDVSRGKKDSGRI